MTILTVRTVPDPVLRQTAAPVASVDTRIAALMRDMVQTMYKNDGIGLAANQVGILHRVIVLDLSEERDSSKALMMANPVILEKSEDTFTYREGCLSVRPTPEDTTSDLYANVKRPRKIKVGYLDIQNKPQELVAEDLLSQCIQHEMDHLDGVLFVDHLSTLKRSIIMRKIEKMQRTEKTEKVF